MNIRAFTCKNILSSSHFTAPFCHPRAKQMHSVVSLHEGVLHPDTIHDLEHALLACVAKAMTLAQSSGCAP